MREGSLDAPTRHPLKWTEASFYDEAALDEELRRVFDICHGCRRCFNLCDSFPKLFDLVDAAPSGEMDTVESKDFGQVIDGCTLCDMCFMTKCPYVPPHEFNLDFPHLMLQAKAVEFRKGQRSQVDAQLAETDRNGKWLGLAAGAVNWVNKLDNPVTRPLVEAVTGIDAKAYVPPFCETPFTASGNLNEIKVNREAPAFGRKAVLYATCFVNYNTPDPGMAAVKVLRHNGVDTLALHPGCCGMPKLENGDLAGVAAQAEMVAGALGPYIDQGYDIVALTPSCALMLKFEWPLLLPDNEAVKKLAKASFDIPEYVVDIAKKEGLAPGLQALDGPVAMHFACHSRAQNMGAKAADMLRLVPDAKVTIVERCSGHGGKWGMFKANFETAKKVGKPAGRELAKANALHVVSECPLAGPHLIQIMEELPNVTAPSRVGHPIELFAKAYGF